MSSRDFSRNNMKPVLHHSFFMKQNFLEISRDFQGIETFFESLRLARFNKITGIFEDFYDSAVWFQIQFIIPDKLKSKSENT